MENIYEVQRIKQVKTEMEIKENSIRMPENAADIARSFIGDDDREVLLVLCLNTKNKVVAVHRAHVGSLNASVVHPREVLKAAILNNAASIIIAHQHPSGDVTPSREDIQVADRMKEAGRIVGIELLDALVVADNSSFTSLKEQGDL
ncbi:JAB domain-containing protein [Alteribacillus bidgolensis]|uniref:DNA repair protein RadC n=1 Tax=Alteribacillus bidgolensis TaxID=930129 RepID=A0A1G8Q896_9BACI|nr:JAB domain-containing protein [Alteribacillus bidgolensis]SDJ00783.1 DNA repair protein RadC [Alteribacillus bidgolensis]